MNGFSPDTPEMLSSPRRLDHAPPLSIGYIMLATAVTAVVLTLLSQTLGTNQRQMGWPVLLMGVWASLTGWVFTAVLLMGWHAVRRTLWRLEPGEWLLICLANALALWMGVTLLQTIFFRKIGLGDDPFKYFWFLRVLQRCVPGEIAAVYLLAAVMQRRHLWWCLAMAGCVAVYLTPYLIMGPDLVSREVFAGGVWLISVGIAIFLAAGIINDRRRNQSRHWIHWTGVVNSGLAILLTVVVMTLALFAR